MDNPFLNYYLNQVGSGISGYSGARYQTGNGFFGKILKSFKPALKYLLREGLKTGVNIGNYLLNGGDIANSVKSNLESTGKSIARDALGMADQYIKQKGGGIKR